MSTAGPQIHTGYWIDHSKGVVLGGTLTYSQNAGSQLISAATIMVSLIGGAVWAISAFFLHQDGVTRGLQDEYDAQKQVVLRNGASPMGTVVAYYNLGSTWHNHTRSAWKRSIVHMLPPALIFIAFTVAGIFVGQIAESPSSSKVLLRQTNQCGTVALNEGTSAQVLKFQSLYANISQIADTYARACYARSSSDSVSCSSYATPRISYTTNYNGSCPIGPGNCEVADGSAINFQALNIDSHEDFGINAPASERMLLNYNLTCAPVKQDLLYSFVTQDGSDGVRDVNGNYSILRLDIGPDLLNGNDYVYSYNEAIKAFSLGSSGYTLNAYSSLYPHNSTNGWVPVSPFNQSRSDINIKIISANGVLYSAPNKDPIFATFDQPLPNDERFYAAKAYFQAMICGENYQICKDGGQACTNWTTLSGLLEEVPRLQLDPARNATWWRLNEAISSANMFLATAIPSPLRAADYILGNSQSSAGLPDNQWTIEVEGWFQSILARMQYIAQSYAVLPNWLLEQSTAIGLETIPPDTPEGSNQCANQRVQTPAGYTSYNVFALVFIFVMTLIALGISMFISQYGHKLPHRHPGGRNYHKLLAYQADGMLQLQRMAFEGAGMGGWRSGKGARKEVPYTEHGTARVPPPIIETKIKSRHNTQDINVEGHNSVDEDWEDGLLYYEKAHVPDDDSDGQMERPK